MSSVLIVDDHPVIRAAVKMVLEQERFTVILEASTGVEAVQMIREHSPDLVILDLDIPNLDGLDVLSRIKASGASNRVLVFTAKAAQFYVSRCMREGALGYIAKTNDLQELRKAVQAIMNNYSYFPRLPESSVSMNDVQRSELQMIESLSDRELSIFQCLARGSSNKDIAEAMLLSHKTVSTYKTRLIEKLNVKSLVHLRDFAKRNQLI
ncbi:response regulator transcription factor [Pseudomonas purpurea]|uniref:response regulator transcription factor n=1 Tax=Pseudomonas purpurea TaxID=3136737 RepID=UPI00326324DA